MSKVKIPLAATVLAKSKVQNINGLAEMIEACAASAITKEQLMDGFELHKIYLED